MDAGQYVAELDAAGVVLFEEDGRLRYRAPKGVLTPERLALLREHKEEVLGHLREREYGPRAEPDPASRHEPFPLTDVQSAYLLGRSEAFDYGGVACHGYLELDLPHQDADTVETAWNDLVRRHGMLRAVILPDGYQRILPQVPHYRIRRHDLTAADADGIARALEEIRGEMSHQVRRTDRWPLFELRVSRTRDTVLLHLAMDLLICDYSGVQTLLAQLARTCAKEPDEAAPDLTFRDYVIAARRAREGTRHQHDHAYWWARLDTLPPAPELPRATGSRQAPPVFRRHRTRLAPGAWRTLTARAVAAGLTPAGVLLQAFAETLGRWSRTRRFTLSLPMNNRLPLHPDVDRIVGDFSSTTLLSVDLAEGTTFLERARTVQARLWEDLDHRLCSGVEVLRELARRRGPGQALLPVTFTSTVGGAGDENPGAPETGGRLRYGITQTPQVWIDCQVMADGPATAVHWDVRDGVFPDGVVEDMFSAFETLVGRLTDDDSVWDAADPVALPARQLERLERANATAAPRAAGALHEKVVAQALRTPGSTAVITPHRSLDYAELLDRSRAVAAALADTGAPPGARVGIVMEKGWEQVAGVLGTLLAGLVYLPVDTTQPTLRRAAVLRDAGADVVLTQSWLGPSLTLPAGVRTIEVDQAGRAAGPLPHETAADPDAPAYVIYTSGSTGTPKGVVISHGAARNTVDDITTRFGIGPGDRVLGLAQLGFDLSVYDIFGPLSAGGALVLPSAGRRGDPAHWGTLVARHGVTVWNSVPAQMQMLEEYARTAPEADLGRLRLALLSGDWIPVTLPGDIRRSVPGLDVISLGGATEAAIWSIHHRVRDSDRTRSSIPYGTPLANQTFRVLDPDLRDCPEHVPGELHIGGAGLAIGYLGDEERTAERFPIHPRTGERLYRTGDMGRRLPDGDIEFLGRVDRQVKLNGHRVELAEVEVALQEHPAVHRAAAVVHGDGAARRLTAFAEPGRTAPRPPSGLYADAADEARKAVRSADRDHGPEIVQMCQALDTSALQAVTLLLGRYGLFATPGHPHTTEEIVRATGAAPAHRHLVRRWLGALEEAGRIERAPGPDAYRGLRPVTPRERAAVRQRIAELEPRVSWGADLVRFHADCEEALPGLLSGTTELRTLLFPQGRTDTAAAAYRDNLISRHNNAAVAAAVRRFVREHRGPGPVRVLEIGAGVGGTSTVLVPALDGLPVDYHFTDVSHFFLNRAQETFADRPWLRYGLFDLGRDPRSQGFAPNSADVVVAANVLHNAVHVPEMLERLRELIAPGGWLVFVDATRDTYRGMVSMEFNAGLSGFRDVRQETGTTFLTHRQWTGLLDEAGADTVWSLPAQDSALSHVGQHVFAARFKADRHAVTPAELHEHLRDRLPAYMIPADLQVVDHLPLTANGKLDHAQLTAWTHAAAPAARTDRGAPPAGELEHTLAAMWSQVLNVPAVGREEDFYGLGGDSLLVAQLVGRMREQLPQARSMEWDDLLRLVLNQPTVAGLAAGISASAGAATGHGTRSPLVPVGDRPAGQQDAPTMVLVHDGTGTVVPYRALIAELSGRLPLAALVLDRIGTYLETDPPRLIGDLAERHAHALTAAGHKRVHLVGYCLGGLVATELAGRLARTGTEVTGLTVISSYRVPYRVEDDLLAEYVFARLMRADTAALGYPQDTTAFRNLVAAVARSHGDTVPRGGLAGRPAADLGPAEEAARRSFEALAGRSQEDRLRTMGGHLPHQDTELNSPDRLLRQYRVVKHSLAAVAAHQPAPYEGPATLVRQVGEAEVFPGMHHDMAAYWRQVCTGELTTVDVPGDHFSCVQPPHVRAMADLLATSWAAGADRTRGQS
ncbi:non-ribosomal peptide synthetase [Streptomyces sp. CB02923]|uniref:non-ribosomal peptide synthetase n=1 Tax=Streptomyces sp. CB02923 TaxID=1718985 RepID=UPI00093CEE45|nr:non-ribosomal peptide synthetase [Streptomyces sp. CB02923]OKI02564.1 non-ribosomal peptide synthetase [Streptomyces sp. CB02923]